MNRQIRRVTAAILSLFLSTSALANEALSDPNVVEAFVDGVVSSMMTSNNSPSGAVAILKDGERVLIKGYGYQDVEEREPVDPTRTLFRPGSVSKLFTWVAVMQLVEQGKLDLDADVNDYLETFAIRDTFDDPVTLRHILTHTAGFEDGALGYLIIEDPDKAVPLRDAMERYQPERVNPPGAQTAYSNYATSLAGLIVANVSGESFEDYIAAHIFEPLGMQNSTFVEPLPEPLASHMATSYAVEGGKYAEKPFEIVSNFSPAGALSSTVTDMLRFAESILNWGELDGNRILERATLEEMLSPAFSHDERMMGMALGFYATDYNGYRVMGHGGDTQWFHSYLGVDRQNNLAFFVSFGGSGGSAVRSAMAPALYDEFYPRQESPPVPPEDFTERAGRYAGTYGFWRSNFSKIDKAFGLSGGVQVAPTADDTLVVSFGGKAKQYAEIEDKLFREMNPAIGLASGISPRLIAFQEDDAGNVTGFIMDGLPFMSLRKLPAYATPAFNYSLLGLSLLILLAVLLRRFFQRSAIRALPAADRSAVNAAVYAAGAQYLALVSGIVVLSIVMDTLFTGIPLLFKLWLVMPIFATAVSAWLFYKTVVVWQRSLLGGVWARIRYTLVALSALFMCWFYYYWNILGFQYL